MDPDFAYGVALAKVGGRTVLRLADADLLPFEFTRAGRPHRDATSTRSQKLADDAAHRDDRAQPPHRRRRLRRWPPTRPRSVAAPKRREPVPAFDFAPLPNAVERLTRRGAPLRRQGRRGGRGRRRRRVDRRRQRRPADGGARADPQGGPARAGPGSGTRSTRRASTPATASRRCRRCARRSRSATSPRRRRRSPRSPPRSRPTPPRSRRPPPRSSASTGGTQAAAGSPRATYGHRKGDLLRSYAVAKRTGDAGAKLEVLQGTLDLMVLQTLDSMGPQHGYGIARRIEQVSEDILKLNEGTVYQALMRLQHQRWISADLGHVGEQPQGQVLRDHRRRPAAAGARSRDLGSAGQRHRAPARRRAGADMWTRLQAWRLAAGVRARPPAPRRRRPPRDRHASRPADRPLRPPGPVARRGLAGGAAPVRQRLGVRQDIHDMNSIGWIERLAGDLRDAVRQCAAAPASPPSVAPTLGLGIGGATAVFSVVEAVLLAPLPYQEPGQPGPPATSSSPVAPTRARPRCHALLLRPRARRLVRGRGGAGALLRDGPRPRRRRARRAAARAARCRAATSRRCARRCALGRGFDRDDETGARRAWCSATRVWRAHFAADPAIVGPTVRLSAETYEVAGVAAAGFVDPFAPDVARWMPYRARRATPTKRTTR